MSIKGIIWFLNILPHSRDIHVFDICKLDSILTNGYCHSRDKAKTRTIAYTTSVDQRVPHY